MTGAERPEPALSAGPCRAWGDFTFFTGTRLGGLRDGQGTHSHSLCLITAVARGHTPVCPSHSLGLGMARGGAWAAAQGRAAAPPGLPGGSPSWSGAAQLTRSSGLPMSPPLGEGLSLEAAWAGSPALAPGPRPLPLLHEALETFFAHHLPGFEAADPPENATRFSI